jgi:hypothetical protein
MAKIVESTIEKLLPDEMNANAGTQYGQHLIEQSLEKFGAGRSILIDKHNRIIAGNKTIENAGAAGFKKVIVVETTGNEIVAVKRSDIDLHSARGREMAIADNASAKANIAFDDEVLDKITADFPEVKIDDWGLGEIDAGNASDATAENTETTGGKSSSLKLEITCKNSKEQDRLYKELIGRGLNCKKM